MDTKFDMPDDFNHKRIDEIENDIRKVYDTNVYIGNHDSCQEDKEKWKFSYCFYVEAKVSYHNIPILYKKLCDKYPELDKSVYDKNRMLFTPLRNRKRNEVIPTLNVIKGSIFDCCTTYFKEDYFDLNTLICNKSTEEKSNPTTTKKTFWETLDECPEDIESSISKFDKINNKIKLLKPERADNYDTWEGILVSS